VHPDAQSYTGAPFSDMNTPYLVNYPSIFDANAPGAKEANYRWNQDIQIHSFLKDSADFSPVPRMSGMGSLGGQWGDRGLSYCMSVVGLQMQPIPRCDGGRLAGG
jgi:hypothetical protein